MADEAQGPGEYPWLKSLFGGGGNGPPPQAFLDAVQQITVALNALTQATLINPFKNYTFATLPAAPGIGLVVVVTDSNTVVWGAAIAGGGANKVLAWWNGANWRVVGI